MRRAALLVALAAAAAVAGEPKPEFVQAVEFPYYLCPRQVWERELVWLKAIGVGAVSFSIPWGWHEAEPGVFDLAGRTNPRRDLAALVKILRRLDLRAWIRPLPPVTGLANGGWPAARDPKAQREWLKELERLLAPQTASHGGPIAYVEGKTLAIDAPEPPAPAATVSLTDPAALVRSRKALAGARGALIWEDVEDTVVPAGQEAAGTGPFRRGAIGLAGEERTSTAPLRRNAALLRGWGAILPGLQSVRLPKPAVKRPDSVQAVELVSSMASAVAISNGGAQPFRDDLRVYEPMSRRTLVIPGVTVAAGDALWLPLEVSIGASGLCRNCSAFSSIERLVYATAELHSMEYENGILSLEFSAAQPGEAVLQLARQPVGPYLAGGRPSKFDFDEKTLRARLPIPAGQGAGNRVRVGLAIEAPETSAFFVEARRLVIGRTNLVSTSYSSAELAARSRLRLPEGWTARQKAKSPLELDYEIDVPAGELHGDWANLAIEADGVLMGRARLQLFRSVSVRCSDAVRLRFGSSAELPIEPPVVPADARAGRNLEIVLRNNSTRIETYRVEASGEGLSFSPAKTEISIGAMMERGVSLRVFPEKAEAGLRDVKIRIGGAAELDFPMRLLLIPRGQTTAWSADLDGDGSVEWILESHRARAVFSPRGGGRWMEFTWKDTGVNVLPEGGIWGSADAVDVKASGGALEFRSAEWKRTVRLEDNRLAVEQTSALPSGAPAPGKHGATVLGVEREAPGRVVFLLN